MENVFNFILFKFIFICLFIIFSFTIISSSTSRQLLWDHLERESTLAGLNLQHKDFSNMNSSPKGDSVKALARSVVKAGMSLLEFL